MTLLSFTKRDSLPPDERYFIIGNRKNMEVGISCGVDVVKRCAEDVANVIE